MEQIKFYYRFKPVFIDFLSEKEIKKYNSELSSFGCLEEQLNILNYSYNNATKERADIIINPLPAISGVTELQVYHKIKFKLFSHDIKENCFCLCITKFNNENELSLFFRNTENFFEVTQIFEDFIENGTIPELHEWKVKFIG